VEWLKTNFSFKIGYMKRWKNILKMDSKDIKRCYFYCNKINLIFIQYKLLLVIDKLKIYLI